VIGVLCSCLSAVCVVQVASSAYARQSVLFDYAMGICKDWKEKGVCGYGDSK
jgi:hypothetical protein